MLHCNFILPALVVTEMSCIVPPNRRRNWLFLHIQVILSVAMLIFIVAAIPAQAQRAGSSIGSGSHSTAAFAASKRALAAGQGSTRQLIRLMDKDKNGVVSKEEFLQFMSEEFDRLDVNRNEQLERRELRRAIPNWFQGSAGFPAACRGGRGPLFCDHPE